MYNCIRKYAEVHMHIQTHYVINNNRSIKQKSQISPSTSGDRMGRRRIQRVDIASWCTYCTNEILHPGVRTVLTRYCILVYCTITIYDCTNEILYHGVLYNKYYRRYASIISMTVHCKNVMVISTLPGLSQLQRFP